MRSQQLPTLLHPRDVQIWESPIYRTIRRHVPAYGNIREAAEGKEGLPFEAFNVIAKKRGVGVAGGKDPEGCFCDRTPCWGDVWRIGVEGEIGVESA